MKEDNSKAISLSEFKTVLNYILDNNKELVKQGKNPIAIGLEAEAGIGKTSVMEQVANERGMSYVKISLSELEEVGDLTGYPVKEFFVQKSDGKGRWVTEEVMPSFVQRGYSPTGNTRLSYATPAWLPKPNPNGCLLNLDDYSRANSSFLQATMELINTGKYFSWKLPENTSIVLTSNPDTGKYTVTSLDEAQKTRFVRFTTKFSIDSWIEWAERYSLDSRAINFAIKYPDIFTKENCNEEKVMNPRSYTMFCNAISGIKDWNSDKGLAMIMNISKGCFNDTENVIGHLFMEFLTMKLDKLMSPKEIITGKWEDVRNRLMECLYDKSGIYNTAVGSILSQRLASYIPMYFEDKGDTKTVENRLVQIIDSPVPIFTEDHYFFIVKNVVSKYRGRCNILLMNPKISSKIAL